MLDPGNYYARLVHGMAGTKGKTDFIALDIEVTHVAQGGQWEPIDVAARKIYIYLTDAAWPQSQKKLAALEHNGDFENPEFGKSEFGVTCEHETYQGKLHERWSLTEWGGQDIQAISKASAMKWATLWRSQTAPAKPKPAGKPTTPKAVKPVATKPEPPPSDDPPPDDQEVPF